MSAPNPAIDIRELRVDYGDFIAVNDLTLAVPEGEVFGLVGPNGAGKTSTFRVLATLQTPTYGSVKLGGMDIFEAPEEARRILGYMPDLAWWPESQCTEEEGSLGVTGLPNIVLEVLSPSTRAFDLVRKRNDYERIQGFAADFA